jgi:hypothetical protein
MFSTTYEGFNIGWILNLFKPEFSLAYKGIVSTVF